MSWYTLQSQRDEDGYPIGFSVDAFVQHPPKLFLVSFDTESTHSSINLQKGYDTHLHKELNQFNEISTGHIEPYYIGGARNDLKVQVVHPEREKKNIHVHDWNSKRSTIFKIRRYHGFPSKILDIW